MTCFWANEVSTQYNTARNFDGTLMRYFLFLACSKATLTLGVGKPSRAATLIFFGGTFKGFVASFLATTLGTIAMAPIAATTDNDLGMAALALKKSTGNWHRQKRPMRTGFNPFLA